MMPPRSRSASKMGLGEGRARDRENAACPETLATAIIEDQSEIRAGLQMLINGWPGFRCTGAFASMEEALEGISADVPHVVLVDIGLPGMSGIEGIPVLRKKFPHLIALVLTVYNDDNRIFE